MRHFIIFSSLVLLCGCSTFKNSKSRTGDDAQNFSQENFEKQKNEIQNELSEEYLDSPLKKSKKRNYTNSNPYAGVKGYLNRPAFFIDASSAKLFRRCEPIEIIGIRNYNNKVFVLAKQNNRTFSLSGINRQGFTKNKLGRVPQLDYHLVKSLDWTNRSRNLAAVNNKVCSGQTWAEMSQAQFRFVYGDPEYRKFMSSNQGQYDVWTYVGADRKKPRHYYFLSYKLYSWTE